MKPGITRRPWTTKEQKDLLEMYGVYRTRSIARYFNRSQNAIRQKIKKLRNES
jgi:ATP-dependent RNA circularization protein (DNA/RNA ligase family)